MWLLRFFPAVFVFGLAALGYWLTGGGTQVPDVPKVSGGWFVQDDADEFLVDEFAAAPDSALFEVFRFDVSPRDLGNRWRRQSAADAGPVYQADLDTGDLDLNLTGSVLYHFDSHNTLRRVVVAGTTTEPEKCADYAADVFGFQLVEDTRPAALLRGQGRHRGQLRLTPLAGGDSDELQRYRVEWSVERL